MPGQATWQSFIKKHYDPITRFRRYLAGSKPCVAGRFSCPKWLPEIADYTTTPTSFQHNVVTVVTSGGYKAAVVVCEMPLAQSGELQPAHT